MQRRRQTRGWRAAILLGSTWLVACSDTATAPPVDIALDAGGLPIGPDAAGDIAASSDTHEATDAFGSDVAGEDDATSASDGSAGEVADDASTDAVALCQPASAAMPDPGSGCGLGGTPTFGSAAGDTFTVAHADYALEVSAFGEILRLRYVPAGATPWNSGAVIGAPTALGVGAACDGSVVVCNAAVVAELTPDGRVRVRDGPGTTLVEGPASPFDPKAGILRRLMAAGERIYGLGPKTGPMNRRGRTYTLWNTDAYDATFGGYDPAGDPLYQSIPFILVRRGAATFGLLEDAPRRQRWDFTGADAWSLTVSGVIDEYVIPGPTPAAVLDRYSALTGRPAMPPRWALGYHQSRWGWPDADMFRTVAARFRAEQIPCDSLWFDIQAMDSFKSFTWGVGFPDPAGLNADLAALGFRSVAIVDPAVKVDPAWDLYTSGLAGGHFLGAPYVGQVWPGPAVFPDFTRAATRAWWGGLVPRHTSVGIDGLWIDMNEPSDFTANQGGTVPNTLPIDGDGQGGTMAEGHQIYGLKEAEATREGLIAAMADRRPVVVTRAGYAGIQRAAMAWTGDAPSRGDVLAGTLPMMLGMGMSGTPFVGSDVGGYSGSTDRALYARWMALGSVSPFFRAHAEKSAPPMLPWDLGTEVRDASRELIAARYRLLPYWYSLADLAHRTGAPLLRPLFWEFEGVDGVEDEAMLGPWLLVAPFLSPTSDGVSDPVKASRTVVLPAGRWFEVRSGAVVDGPTTVTVSGPLAALPMWAREGAIVPHGPLHSFEGDGAAGPLDVDVYPSAAGSEFTVFDDAGDGPAGDGPAGDGPAGDGPAEAPWRRTRWEAQATPDGARVVVTVEPGSTFVPPARRIVVRLRRVDHAPSEVTLDGGAMAGVVGAVESTGQVVSAAKAGWTWDEADLALVIWFDDPGAFVLKATYDPALTALAPAVAVPLRVTAPVGTTAVSVAHSGNGWVHVPLEMVGDHAVGTVVVPRGAWFDYKYSRGSWVTVEKWPGCQEATNRYAYGAAHPGKVDTIYVWADGCGP